MFAFFSRFVATFPRRGICHVKLNKQQTCVTGKRSCFSLLYVLYAYLGTVVGGRRGIEIGPEGGGGT